MVPKKYFKKLEDHDIWECRINFAGTAYRLLGFLQAGAVVLTNGFIKKTRKTPPQEIKTAENYKDDFITNGGLNR
jgi:phage-related protein